MTSKLANRAAGGGRRGVNARLLFWALGVVLLTLAGCSGTLEMGLETTPTPDPRPVATIAALREENAQLSAQAAARPTAAAPQLSLGRLGYVQGSDIWYRSLPDGRPQRLTSDGRNREPRWSPSGYWLAFRKERSVYVRREVPCDIFKPRQDVCYEWASQTQRQVWVVDVAGGRRAPGEPEHLRHGLCLVAHPGPAGLRHGGRGAAGREPRRGGPGHAGPHVHRGDGARARRPLRLESRRPVVGI